MFSRLKVLPDRALELTFTPVRTVTLGSSSAVRAAPACTTTLGYSLTKCLRDYIANKVNSFRCFHRKLADICNFAAYKLCLMSAIWSV